MMFGTKSALLRMLSATQSPHSVGKVGIPFLFPCRIPASPSLHPSPWAVLVQSHPSSSLRGWMGKAGFQPGLFNKDISTGNKKLRSGSRNLTGAE